MNRRIYTVASLTLLVAAAMALPHTASARGHGRSSSGAQMRSGPAFPSSRTMSSRSTDMRRVRENDQRRTTVERTDTGITRTTTVTNPHGTMTSTTSVTRDEATGTRTIERERTGFDGQTSAVSTTIQKTDDGLTRTHAVTTPSGNTSTQTLSVSKDADGNAVVERSAERVKQAQSAGQPQQR
jgi:hypothetical protein